MAIFYVHVDLQGQYKHLQALQINAAHQGRSFKSTE